MGATHLVGRVRTFVRVEAGARTPVAHVDALPAFGWGGVRRREGRLGIGDGDGYVQRS